MKERRAVLHGFLNIEDKGKLVVLNLESTDALHRSDFIFRNDNRDIVAVVAHVPVQQMAGGNVLMRRVHGPRMARGREADVRNVKAGENLHNAFDGLGFARVDRLYKAVRDGGMLDPHIKRIMRHQILVILCAAGDFVKGIDSYYTFAGFHEFFDLLECCGTQCFRMQRPI